MQWAGGVLCHERRVALTRRATFDKIASSTVTQISEVAGGGSSP